MSTASQTIALDRDTFGPELTEKLSKLIPEAQALANEAGDRIDVGLRYADRTMTLLHFKEDQGPEDFLPLVTVVPGEELVLSSNLAFAMLSRFLSVYFTAQTMRETVAAMAAGANRPAAATVH